MITIDLTEAWSLLGAFVVGYLIRSSCDLWAADQLTKA
jgi:hypothetical protein